MRAVRIRWLGASALALCLALGAGGAGAQQLKTLGAALALPVITGETSARQTWAVVTNAASSARLLHLLIIDGDDWRAIDFTCYVTASESTLIRFVPSSNFTQVFLECTNPVTGEEQQESFTIVTREGILFVSVEDPATGLTLNETSLFGDATVLDFDQGVAYSVDAFAFPGVDPSAPGVGDRRFRFDGVEYTRPPATLSTEFMAPDGPEVTAELILFTLDGTVGASAGPRGSVDITFYDDDERAFSTSHLFDCFDVISLTDIDSRFDRASLGSESGHLWMDVQIVERDDPAHDFEFDGGPGFDQPTPLRRTPVLGWIVQTASGQALPGGAELEGVAAWARKLNSSVAPLTPSTGDVPVLKAF